MLYILECQKYGMNVIGGVTICIKWSFQIEVLSIGKVKITWELIFSNVNDVNKTADEL